MENVKSVTYGSKLKAEGMANILVKGADCFEEVLKQYITMLKEILRGLNKQILH